MAIDETTLGEVMHSEGHSEATVILDQVAAGLRAGALPMGSGCRVATQVGYQLGLEVGIRIGVADGAAARRFRRHFDDVVQGGDPEAIAGSVRRAAIYLAVLGADDL